MQLHKFKIHWGAICLITVLSLVMYGCGGGGSSSSSAMEDMENMEDSTSGEGGMAGTDDESTEEDTAKTAAEEEARIMGLTAAIADPDSDGVVPEPGELDHRNRPAKNIDFDYATGTVDGDELRENDTDIKNDNEFQPSNEPRADLMNFDASVYVRTTTKGYEDTLTVYTDYEEAGDEKWNTWYGTDGTNGLAEAEITAPSPITDQPDEEETIYTAITIAPDTSDISGNTAISRKVARLMSGSKIPTGAGQRRVIDTDGTVKTFDGLFNGVSGKYTCADACTISTDDDDGTMRITGTLSFQPNKTINDTDDEHKVAGVILDKDFISFGYWLQNTRTKYGVSVFSGGSMPYGTGIDGASPATEIVKLAGKATYDGSATGLYTRKQLSAEDGRVVVGVPVAAGQFSADVSLTAYFDNTSTAISDADELASLKLGDIPDNKTFHIEGMVDNFQDADGMIDTSWELSLNAAGFTGTNTFDDGGTGDGDSKGEWSGQFFGNATDFTSDTLGDRTGSPELNNATNYPTGVAGEFTGHFTNGHVIGAFGANSQ